MESPVRTHKRNKAVESLEKNLTQSINLTPGRLSFGHDYNGPLTMRLSDLSSTHTETYLTSPHQMRQSEIPRYPSTKKEKAVRPLSNLKSNLLQLEQKLTVARCQLEIKTKGPIRSAPPSTTDNILGLFVCPEVQQDESTINLESHKKLLSIKSKEKLSKSSKLKEYYVGTLIRAISGNNPLAQEHLETSLKLFKQAVSLQIPSIFAIQHRKLYLNRSPAHQHKKTLFLQLNETLLCLRDKETNPDDIKIGSAKQPTYISLRPYAISFLKKMANYFEVIIWTTLEPSLVELILEEIDHEQKLISHRIFKQHCSMLKRDILTKDLRGVNRNLKEVIIVDSNPESYVLQPDNAVPLVPFRGGNDRQLMDLQRYLIREVSVATDVRDVNRRKFKLNNYWQHDNEVYLVKDLYLNDESYY